MSGKKITELKNNKKKMKKGKNSTNKGKNIKMK
jgi:hypothetical protein